jgi:hypothetical protein
MAENRTRIAPIFRLPADFRELFRGLTGRLPGRPMPVAAGPGSVGSQAAFCLKLPRFYGLFSLCPAGLRARNAALDRTFSARLQPPFSHILPPVEMNVLISQPKSSQNGKVDATGYGNIISN